FIHARPATLEEDRERQFGQPACLRLTDQRLAQTEQRHPTALKAVIHLLTKCVHCVTVHPRNAPFLNFLDHYSYGLALTKELALSSHYQPSSFISLTTNQKMGEERRRHHAQS